MNKLLTVLVVNKAGVLIDRVVLCPWGSSVAGRLRRHPSRRSRLEPSEPSALCLLDPEIAQHGQIQRRQQSDEARSDSLDFRNHSFRLRVFRVSQGSAECLWIRFEEMWGQDGGCAAFITSVTSTSGICGDLCAPAF